MNILMVSLDTSLLVGSKAEEAVIRHRRYGELLGGKIWIVVLAGTRGPVTRELSSEVKVFSTCARTRIGKVWRGLRIARRLAKEFHPDLIVTQDPFFTGLIGWLLKRRFKIPLAIHFHGDFWNNPYARQESRLYFWLLPLSKFLAKQTDKIRTTSETLREKLIQAGLPPQNVVAIPPPVDVSSFFDVESSRVAKVRRQFGGRPFLLSVGRLDPVKNIPLLFEVLGKIPQVNLVIIGEGKERKALEIMAAKRSLEGRAHFLGQIAYSELPAYYHAAELVVLPSWSESFGKVLVEAGAAGKAVVATATTGARFIVEDGKTGYLVPLGDAEMFRAKVAELLKDSGLRQRIGEAARERVRTVFDPEINSRKLVEFWKSCTS